MADIGATTVTVTNVGSYTIAPGGGALVAGTVLRIHIRNIGPEIAYVSANYAGAVNGHVDSSPRGENGYMLLPGEAVIINAPEANLNIVGNIPTRVSILAEA